MYLNETEFMILVVGCIFFGYLLNKLVNILEKIILITMKKFNLN